MFFNRFYYFLLLLFNKKRKKKSNNSFFINKNLNNDVISPPDCSTEQPWPRSLLLFFSSKFQLVCSECIFGIIILGVKACLSILYQLITEYQKISLRLGHQMLLFSNVQIHPAMSCLWRTLKKKKILKANALFLHVSTSANLKIKEKKSKTREP